MAFDLGSVFVTFQAKTDQFVAAIEGAKGSISSVGDTLNKMGDVSLAVGAVITGAMGIAVKAASDYEAANTKLTAGLTAIQQAGEAQLKDSGENAAATEVLTNKKNTLVASIKNEQDALDKATDKYGANSVQVQQSQAKLATYQTQLETVNSKLDAYSAATQAAGLNVQETSKAIDEIAESNTSFGFTVEDTLGAMTSQMTIFKNLKDATNANNIAMDLARYQNEDLATATKQVDLAYQGQGKALKAFGINIKDTATGTEALSELQAQVAGQAVAYSKTTQGQAEAAKAKIAAISATLGTQLLPYVSQFLTMASDVISKIVDWTNKNPALTAEIVKVAAVLGPVLIALGVMLKAAVGIIQILPDLIKLWDALGVAFEFLTSAAGLWLIAITAVALGAYEIYAHWSQIKPWLENLWNDVMSDFSAAWNWIKAHAVDIIEAIVIAITGPFGLMAVLIYNNWATIKKDASTFWTDFKNIFSDVGQFFANIGKFILNGILSPVQTVIDGINTLIKGADKLPGINIPTIPNIPHFAAGISGFGGGWAMVGDVAGTNSGELVKLPQGSSVLSNRQSKSELKNGKGGGTVNVTVNAGALMGNAADARTLAETIQRHIIRYNRQVGT